MLYDITPPVVPELAVWPGDTKASREILLNRNNGAGITLSTLHATVHLGAHADGPNHYENPALQPPGIGEVPLTPYLGRCQVVTAQAERGTRVQLEDLTAEIAADRVLLRTSTYPDPMVFNTDFAGIDPSVLDALAATERGLKLLGIDTPSVDLFDDKELLCHGAFARNSVAVLEGLVLDGVPDGFYELIALPLRLIGFDASPVRAVLRPLEG